MTNLNLYALLEKALSDPETRKNINNKIDADGNTALHIAVALNDFDIVQLLYENGANILITNNQGETPVTFARKLAIDNGYQLIIAAYESARNKNIPFEPEKGIDIYAYLFEHSHAHMLCFNAVTNKEANFRLVWRELLPQVPINIADEQGNTSLHLAAYFGNNDALDWLIANGADVFRKNFFGKTPLEWAFTAAAAQNTYQELDEIIERQRLNPTGVPIELTGPLLACYKLIIAEAQANNQPLTENDATGEFIKLIIKMLMETLNISHPNTVYNQEVIVNLTKENLIKNGDLYLPGITAPIKLETKGQQPRVGKKKTLLQAAKNGDLICIKNLLKTKARSPNIANEHGNTALHLAAEAGHNDCVAFLLNQGASITSNKNGETPVSLAQKNKHRACMITLLQFTVKAEGNDSKNNSPKGKPTSSKTNVKTKSTADKAAPASDARLLPTSEAQCNTTVENDAVPTIVNDVKTVSTSTLNIQAQSTTNTAEFKLDADTVIETESVNIEHSETPIEIPAPELITTIEAVIKIPSSEETLTIDNASSLASADEIKPTRNYSAHFFTQTEPPKFISENWSRFGLNRSKFTDGLKKIIFAIKEKGYRIFLFGGFLRGELHRYYHHENVVLNDYDVKTTMPIDELKCLLNTLSFKADEKSNKKKATLKINCSPYVINIGYVQPSKKLKNVIKNIIFEADFNMNSFCAEIGDTPKQDLIHYIPIALSHIQNKQIVPTVSAKITFKNPYCIFRLIRFEKALGYHRDESIKNAIKYAKLLQQEDHFKYKKFFAQLRQIFITCWRQGEQRAKHNKQPFNGREILIDTLQTLYQSELYQYLTIDRKYTDLILGNDSIQKSYLDIFTAATIGSTGQLRALYKEGVAFNAVKDDKTLLMLIIENQELEKNEKNLIRKFNTICFLLIAGASLNLELTLNLLRPQNNCNITLKNG